MIETTVESIRVSLVTQNRVVILREVDGDRHLPIWIGAYEAEAIAMELQGVTATRPLPYDLIRVMLGELDATIDEVRITNLNDQVYYARIVLNRGSGNPIEIDARPSDAIAIAVRTGTRILVAESIMEEASVSMPGDDADAEIDVEVLDDTPSITTSTHETIQDNDPSTKGDEHLGVFRDFINSLDLDDFDRNRSN